MSNRFFLIQLRDDFIKNGYETTYSHNAARIYNHRCSAKRFIDRIKSLKAWACKSNPESCCYYQGCLEYRQQNECLNECGLKNIQNNIDNLKIGEFRLELVKTDKARA